MPANPTDTLTFTTHDAGAWCVPATRDDEIARLTSENERLRRLGDAMKAVIEEYRGPVWSNTLNTRAKDAIAAWPSKPAPAVSSSDPCPECSSSRWAPNGDCPACVKRAGVGIVASVDALRAAGGDAWDGVEDVEGEMERPVVTEEFCKAADIEASAPITAGHGLTNCRCGLPGDTASQTASDMDAQRRHGRQRRLILAAEEVIDGLPGTFKDVPRDIQIRSRWKTDGQAIRKLINAVAEFSPDDTGPVAVQTEAERENERLREEVEERDSTIERLRDEFTRVSRAKQQQIDEARGTLANTVDRLMASHKEVDSLRSQLAASQAEVERLKAEVERLKAEVQSAEKDESHAFGVMDSIDTTVANALESLGLDTLAGTGFPWRVDALVEAAKEYKAEIRRLEASLAASQAREAATTKRCEAVVKACDRLGGDRQPIKFGYGGWTGVQEHRLSILRSAVDTLRQPATEAKP